MDRQLARRLISYARGAGSILDIAPTSTCDRLVHGESFNERLRTSFQRVGGALRHGADALKDEISRNEPPKTSPPASG